MSHGFVVCQCSIPILLLSHVLAPVLSASRDWHVGDSSDTSIRKRFERWRREIPRIPIGIPDPGGDPSAFDLTLVSVGWELFGRKSWEETRERTTSAGWVLSQASLVRQREGAKE